MAPQALPGYLYVNFFTRPITPVKLAVCIKRVPEMDVKFRIAPSGRAVDETGLKWDMSDFDSYAVEAALQMIEKRGEAGGEVTVISLGPEAVKEVLRKALSMGANRAVHLECSDVPFDAAAIAEALAAELKDGSYDLIMFGKMAIDTAAGAVGVMVGEKLGVPTVHACSKLEIANGHGTARRELEGGAELLRFPLPAVVTIDEGIARPRYPSLKGIMAAKKKPMDSRPAQLGSVRVTVEEMQLPPERAAGRILGQGAAAVPELVRLMQTEAKVL
ncbi:MAG: electron transfer flavoprotein subunit beta/FixA family protein [Gemmatimonadaceae bacterium]